MRRMLSRKVLKFCGWVCVLEGVYYLLIKCKILPLLFNRFRINLSHFLLPLCTLPVIWNEKALPPRSPVQGTGSCPNEASFVSCAVHIVPLTSSSQLLSPSWLESWPSFPVTRFFKLHFPTYYLSWGPFPQPFPFACLRRPRNWPADYIVKSETRLADKSPSLKWTDG